jgi:deoxyhypusine synthase
MTSNGTKLTVDALYTRCTDRMDDRPAVAGYNFDNGTDYDALLKSLYTTGFQATNFALAVDQVNQMVSVSCK